ncbi:MAG: glycosyltransferase family 4 protein [Terriglobales bacterium]
MKIILVHNSYQLPGGEDVVFEQELQLLRSRGNQVIVYHRSNSEIEQYSGLQRLCRASALIWAKDTRDEMACMIRRERPQLVHIHNTFFMISPSVYSACWDAGVPVVQTLHNYRLLCPAANLLRKGQTCEECMGGTFLPSVVHGCYRGSRAASAMVALALTVHWAKNTWTRMVDCYIALSEVAAHKFVEGGLPAHKLVVKPNFVHPDPGVRKDSGDYALYVGRLSSEKGTDTLLEAWKHVRSRVPLLIVGDGPLRESYLKDQCDSRVTFCGLLPRAEVLKVLKRARFLVVPSRCYENFPMTIVEAYACGVPVIGADIGAIRELVAHGRTGLLFRPGDSEHLAKSVEWAWSRPTDLKHMGNECRAEFGLRYSAERNYQLLLGIYGRVTSGRTAGATAYAMADSHTRSERLVTINTR